MLVARTENLTKSYRLGAERSSWRSLVPGRFGEQRTGEWFDALKDVSIEIEKGESLGIIGTNGAGKSTLLKILSGIVAPTSGTVDIRGRVASIIELGVGFNPELSGEENLEFAGALIGIGPDDVRRKRDEIVGFAGLESFMGMPVKRFSTGMRARLGFALATSFPADLVILDEVLAVGDWAFQQKCLERIRELHREGSTLVFVSHSPWLTLQICDRALLIEEGRVMMAGDPMTVIEHYLGKDTILDTTKDTSFPVLAQLEMPSTNSTVRISDLRLSSAAIEIHDRLQFRFQLDVDEPVDAIIVMSIYTLGRAVFAQPAVGPRDLFTRSGCYEVGGITDRLPFSPGGYKLRVAVIPGVNPDDIHQDHLDALAAVDAPFRVVGDVGIRPGLQWQTDWWTRPLSRKGSDS